MKALSGQVPRTFTYIIILLIIIYASFSVSTSYASESVYQISGGTIRSATINVPAVAGKYGELIEVTVSVEVPGHGLIHVYSGSSVGNSTFYSIATAAYTAALFLGLNPNILDVNVTFHTRDPISGPSASLAVASTIYSLLNPLSNTSRLSNYVVTGAIIPQGYAGPVGGVDLKCKAAAEHNLHFIAPLANKPDITPSCMPHLAGLATSLLDVSSIASGSPRPSPTPQTPDYPNSMKSIMAEAAVNMSKTASSLISETSNLIHSTNLGPSVYGRVEALLNSSSKNLASANSAINSRPYSAASYAFTALYQALTAYYLAKLSLSQIDVNREISAIEGSLHSLQLQIANRTGTKLCLNKLEILSVAAARLSDALYSLDTVKLARSQNALDLELAASGLAGARARIYSIESWLETYDSLNCTLPPLYNLQQAMSEIHRYTNIIYNYTVSVLQEVGLSQAAQPLKTLATRANTAYDRGDYILALGYYRDLLSKSTSILFSNFLESQGAGEEIALGYLNSSMTIYYIHKYQLLIHGVKSILGEAYLEYTLDLASRGDILSALAISSSAIAAEEIMLLLLDSIFQAGGSGHIQPPPLSSCICNSSLYVISTTLSAAILGVSLGFALALRAYAKRLEARIT